MAAPIPEDILEKVRSIWSDNAKQSGRQVHRVYRQRFGGGIGLRKVQEIVSLLKKVAPRDPFPLVEWLPWEGADESPEDSAFLLWLNAQSMQLDRRGLYQHEARWVRRLRVALDGLGSSEQLRIVRAYAQRQVVGYNLRERPYTGDLDGIVAYRAWLPENVRGYAQAAVFGLVPLPVPIRRTPGDYKGFIDSVNEYLDGRSEDNLPVERDMRSFAFRLLHQVMEAWGELQEELDRLEETQTSREV